MTLLTTAMDNYTKDDEVFNFECPICQNQAYGALAMFGDSLHGVIECENCDSHIHI